MTPFVKEESVSEKMHLSGFKQKALEFLIEVQSFKFGLPANLPDMQSGLGPSIIEMSEGIRSAIEQLEEAEMKVKELGNHECNC